MNVSRAAGEPRGSVTPVHSTMSFASARAAPAFGVGGTRKPPNVSTILSRFSTWASYHPIAASVCVTAPPTSDSFAVRRVFGTVPFRAAASTS
jgi:hypothetical protein